MNARGRRAALPSHDHSRPEYVSPDGLVVSHHNHAGRVKHYDFATLPVAEAMQRSLAALFAERCVPARWTAHSTSTGIWFCVQGFAKFIADQERPPRDLDGLTVDGGDWWFNVRASNTEPLLRLNVEGKDEATMTDVRDRVLAVIRDKRMLRNPAQGQASKAPYQGPAEIFYKGQPIALVVADTLEQAQAATDAKLHTQ